MDFLCAQTGQIKKCSSLLLYMGITGWMWGRFRRCLQWMQRPEPFRGFWKRTVSTNRRFIFILKPTRENFWIRIREPRLLRNCRKSIRKDRFYFPVMRGRPEEYGRTETKEEEQSDGYIPLVAGDMTLYQRPENPVGENWFFAVNKNSEKQEKACEFLNWFYTPENIVKLYEEKEGMDPYRKEEEKPVFQWLGLTQSEAGFSRGRSCAEETIAGKDGGRMPGSLSDGRPSGKTADDRKPSAGNGTGIVVEYDLCGDGRRI